jgi:transposase
MTSWDRWTVSARLYGALGLGAVVVLGALGMGYAQMRRGEALLSAITRRREKPRPSGRGGRAQARAASHWLGG